MAHDHSFDCRQCGAHLDSQQELNEHNRNEHSIQGKPSDEGQSSQSRSDNDVDNRDARL